jgi:hypothetical protein
MPSRRDFISLFTSDFRPLTSAFRQCPEWESNPQTLGFKPSRSAAIGVPGPLFFTSDFHIPISNFAVVPSGLEPPIVTL